MTPEPRDIEPDDARKDTHRLSWLPMSFGELSQLPCWLTNVHGNRIYPAIVYHNPYPEEAE